MATILCNYSFSTVSDGRMSKFSTPMQDEAIGSVKKNISLILFYKIDFMKHYRAHACLNIMKRTLEKLMISPMIVAIVSNLIVK